MTTSLAAPTIDRIEAAAGLIKPHVLRTPLVPGPRGYLKVESLQPTGSFKVRGFFAAALQSSAEEVARGLMTISAGNAALACAYAARHLKTSCRVVMFDTAPQAKRVGVERLGAEVVPMPFDEVIDMMRNERWTEDPRLFVHPFADERVMAGSGTIALELLEDLPDLTRVVVPVGGGGLVVGIASALRALKPGVEVVGVQSDGYALWREAFKAGGPVSLKPVTVADGTTGPFHPVMFELLKELVDTWVVVPEAGVRRGVARLAVEARLVAEGAGALGYAALEMLEPRDGTVALVSGGNIDGARLAELLLEAQAAG